MRTYGAAPRDHKQRSRLPATVVPSGRVSVALAGAIFAGSVARPPECACSGQVSGAHPALQQTFTIASTRRFGMCCIAAVGVFTSLVRGKEQKGTGISDAALMMGEQ